MPGDGFWRVTVLRTGNYDDVKFTRSVDVNDAGRVAFTNLDGERVIIGPATPYKIQEVAELPPTERAKLEDAEVLTDS